MMTAEQPPTLETDPRFPSGPWTGFFLQRGFPGKQMMDLRLTFQAGNLNGEGRDWVGEFLIKGRYDLAEFAVPCRKADFRSLSRRNNAVRPRLNLAISCISWLECGKLELSVAASCSGLTADWAMRGSPNATSSEVHGR